MTQRSLLNVIAKVALCATLSILALILLNSAIFSLWAAGGPPNNTPGPWILRAENHFAIGVSCLLFALAVPIGAVRISSRSFLRVAIGRSLIILALVVAIMPMFFR